MNRVKPLRARVAPILLLLLGLGVAGCTDFLDRLLDVGAPSRVIAADLDDPSRVGLMVESSWNEFRCAFAHYINVSGMVGWELRSLQNGGTTPYYDSRNWASGGWPSGSYARGTCAGGGAAHYRTLSTSRWFADEMLRRLEEWGSQQVPEKQSWDAELATWAGYSYLFTGVSMCSVAFDEGPEQPPEYALERAVERFDQAITAAQGAGRADLVDAARIGKGRTLLNLGRTSEAAAAVASVPDGFRFDMPFSGIDNSTRNRQYHINQFAEQAGVAEPYRNMEFAGVADPRVVVQDAGRDVAGYGVPLWYQLKYTSWDDPVPLARSEEAQLIRAEAALEEGRSQDAVDIINVLHTRAGLPEFQSSDRDEILDMIIYNRRAEFFLESHHLEDLNRFDLPLVPAPGEPFAMGGVYGSQRCFPLPDEETANNPNIPTG